MNAILGNYGGKMQRIVHLQALIGFKDIMDSLKVKGDTQ
jgi:hypothetical protein